MHFNEVDFGAIIKAARNEKGMTQEMLAEKSGVGLRHMMGIENEGKNPSFEVLYDMIRALNVSADVVFYPEKKAEDSGRQYLTHLLSQCDDRSIRIITALVESLLKETGSP